MLYFSKNHNFLFVVVTLASVASNVLGGGYGDPPPTTTPPPTCPSKSAYQGPSQVPSIAGLKTDATKILKGFSQQQKTPTRPQQGGGAPQIQHDPSFSGTDSAPPPPAGPSSLPQEKQDCLNAHNVARKKVHVPDLSWDSKLEADAYAYAKTFIQSDGSCLPMKHNLALLDQLNEGENLFSGGGVKYTLTDAVNAFINEPYTPGGDFNHYTQVVWRQTSRVGCAAAFGNNCQITSCRYQSRGNVVGSLPY